MGLGYRAPTAVQNTGKSSAQRVTGHSAITEATLVQHTLNLRKEEEASEKE